WAADDFDRPWRCRNPADLAHLVQTLQRVAQGRQLVIALEPTGTYGDALRQALQQAGLRVHRVSPKAAADYAEIFDGVPSQHDGKDAAVVAELTAQGRCWPWPLVLPGEVEQELAYQVEWLEGQRRQTQLWYGRLEALVSRHWPEATALLPLTSGVLRRCLLRYGGPRRPGQGSHAPPRLYPLGQRPVASGQDRGVGSQRAADGRRADRMLGRGTPASLCPTGARRVAAASAGPAAAATTGGDAADHPGDGRGGRPGDSVCAVGGVGQSPGLSLRSGLPQGDGAQSERTQQWSLAGSAQDQQAWFQRGAALAVPGGVALAAAGTGAELVCAAQGARAGRCQAGVGRRDAQVGGGGVPRWRAAAAFRPGP